MKDYGIVTEPGVIRFERLLPGPAERVWAYLTESEKRAKWLASGEMELKPGGKISLFFLHETLSSEKEKVPEKYKEHENGSGFDGIVIQCEPPRLLSFTWGGEKERSEVTFELFPQGDKVLLVLTHRNLGGRNAMLSVAAGWHTHLQILQDHFQGNDPGGFWSAHTQFEKDYGERI